MGNSSSSSGLEGRLPNEEDLPFLQVLGDKRCLDWRNSPDPETGLALSTEDQRRMKREQGCLPVHISSNVFLSDARSAQKVGRLKHLGIAYVVNVGGKALEPPNLDDYKNQGIDYKCIDASKETRVLESYLADVRDYVAMAREKQRNVLVYCKSGYDLSGLFVASEKMLMEGRKVLETVAECRRLRGNDFLGNVVYQENLIGLARKTGLLGMESERFMTLPKQEQTSIVFDPVRARGVLRGENLPRPTSMNSTRSQSSAGSQGSLNPDFANSFSSSIKGVFNSMGSSMGSLIAPTAKPRVANDEDEIYVRVLADPLCLNWRNRPEAETGHMLTLEEQEQISKGQKNMPILMCENLYIANTRAINRVGRLKHIGITHVLNLAGPDAAPSSMESLSEAGILYKMIATEKDQSSVVERYLAEVREFIAKAREGGGSCVLYCKTGSDVSAAFVAAEKMLCEGTELLATVAACRRLRGNQFLQNESLQEQLLVLARTHSLLGRAESYLDVLPGSVDRAGRTEDMPLLSS